MRIRSNLLAFVVATTTVLQTPGAFSYERNANNQNEDSFQSNTLSEMRYFAQRNNRNNPGGTCGITSGAMLMSAWTESGRSAVTPDMIFERYGTHTKGKSPNGLASIYKDYGFEATSTKTGTRAEMFNLLDMGYPLVVHGWFTNGHIIVIKGYNDEGFIVNDPAGDWLRCAKCGYKRGTSGKGLVYKFSEMTDRVISYDGDIWYSYITRSR